MIVCSEPLNTEALGRSLNSCLPYQGYYDKGFSVEAQVSVSHGELVYTGRYREGSTPAFVNKRDDCFGIWLQSYML